MPAHTNFNSLLLHFVALKELSSAMRLKENIDVDAVTISADLIWARRVHQLVARSVSRRRCSPSSFSFGFSAVVDLAPEIGFGVDIGWVGIRMRLVGKEIFDF